MLVIFQIERKELVDFIRNHPDIGLIAMMAGIWASNRHQDTTKPLFPATGYVSMLMICFFLTFSAQGLIFLVFVGITLKEYWERAEEAGASTWDEILCFKDGSAASLERLVMMLISWIYVSRLMILCARKFNDAMDPTKGNSVTPRTHSHANARLPSSPSLAPFP